MMNQNYYFLFLLKSNFETKSAVQFIVAIVT